MLIDSVKVNKETEKDVIAAMLICICDKLNITSNNITTVIKLITEVEKDASAPSTIKDGERAHS